MSATAAVTPAADVAAPLDSLLVQAAQGPYRRFTDPAWAANPVLRRLVQAYLAGGQTARALVVDADLEWRDAQRVGFLVENVVEAMSPSNVPLVNPSSAKAAIDTAGLSLVRGGEAFLRDMASAPRIPEMVDGSGFRLGDNVAATPGDVVHRTELVELIRYRPQSHRVRQVPLLIVPPTINKYYALDLAPDRSLIEYLVSQGQQVFVISWRNPDARHAGWGLDTYVQAVIDTLDVVQRTAGTEQAALTGVCSGGIIASLAAARLAAIGRQDRLAAFTLLVTVLDSHRSGTTSALIDENLAAVAKATSGRRGYLDGRALAEVFAWLRPGDLIWNYWVNNYLLGQRPPAFDILFWNADTTRMPAQLHADFVDFGLQNKITQPGALSVLGSPVDLSRFKVDAYVLAGSADHITPWQNCFRSTGLLGGDTRFVLSTSGHIAALVNPPTNPKAGYQAGDGTPADPQQWQAAARTHPGSWWPDYSNWLADRCGPTIDAPEFIGPPLAPAPGTYVFEK